eukprot:scaffold26205_cov67-Skeletonema_dohrnii-CCMP3373.AAC.1
MELVTCPTRTKYEVYTSANRTTSTKRKQQVIKCTCGDLPTYQGDQYVLVMNRACFMNHQQPSGPASLPSLANQ